MGEESNNKIVVDLTEDVTTVDEPLIESPHYHSHSDIILYLSEKKYTPFSKRAEAFCMACRKRVNFKVKKIVISNLPIKKRKLEDTSPVPFSLSFRACGFCPDKECLQKAQQKNKNANVSAFFSPVKTQ